MSRLHAALLTLALAPAAGCGLFSDDIEPIYEIDDDSYVVVYPFKDPAFDSPWESRSGHLLARATTDELTLAADFYVVPYDDVLALMVARKDDDSVGLDVSKLTPGELAELVGADYVVLGDIALLQGNDPKNLAITQASGTLDVQLFKVAKTRRQKQDAVELSEREKRMRKAYADAGLNVPGETPHGGKVVASARVTGSYPDTYLGQYGESFLDPQQAEAGLVRVLGRKTAQLFYEHEPDELKGSSF